MANYKEKSEMYPININGKSAKIPVTVTLRRPFPRIDGVLAIAKVTYAGIVINDIKIERASAINNGKARYGYDLTYPKVTFATKSGERKLTAAYPIDRELSRFFYNLIVNTYTEWQIEREIERAEKTAETKIKK